MTLNSQQLDRSDIGVEPWQLDVQKRIRTAWAERQPHGVDGRTDLKACIGCQTGCANRKLSDPIMAGASGCRCEPPHDVG